MKWWERIIKTRARKYLVIAILMASGVGAPVALTIGTAVDQAADEILQDDA